MSALSEAMAEFDAALQKVADAQADNSEVGRRIVLEYAVVYYSRAFDVAEPRYGWFSSPDMPSHHSVGLLQYGIDIASGQFDVTGEDKGE